MMASLSHGMTAVTIIKHIILLTARETDVVDGKPTTNELPLECSFELRGRTRHTTLIASLVAIVSYPATSLCNNLQLSHSHGDTFVDMAGLNGTLSTISRANASKVEPRSDNLVQSDGESVRLFRIPALDNWPQTVSCAPTDAHH